MSAPIRIGINGFGRIGRLALRAGWDWPEFEFVHINEANGDAETGEARRMCVHLLRNPSRRGEGVLRSG